LDQAGDSIVDAALNPALTEGGKFFCDKSETRSHEITYNKDIQNRLWELSEKWIE
jgi:hypothetical protein